MSALDEEIAIAEAALRKRGGGGGTTSFIQRTLGCGYNHAALLTELMVERGILTESDERGHRKLLPPPGDHP